jgi:hypothetical protein
MYHYWVPVPKGLWYIYNGETLRIPANGLYDLLTGEFARGYEYGDTLVYPDAATDKKAYNNKVNNQLIFLKN